MVKHLSLILMASFSDEIDAQITDIFFFDSASILINSLTVDPEPIAIVSALEIISSALRETFFFNVKI